MTAVENSIVRNWLSKGISEKAMLLHGTSIDALMKLIETGFLPTGSPQEDVTRDATADSLYFYPVGRNFVGSEYSYRLSSEMVEDAEVADFEYMSGQTVEYADSTARGRYLLSQLGIRNPTHTLKTAAVDLVDTPDDLDEVHRDLEEVAALGIDVTGLMEDLDIETQVGLLKEKLAEYNLIATREELLIARDESKGKRGIIIEPSSKIFQLPYNSIDVKMQVVCPDGLSPDYIEGISVLGGQERQELDRYLASR